MDLLAVIHLYMGLVEDVWVTDKEAVAETWRTDLDAMYGIARDEDGEPVVELPHQVLVWTCHRRDIG